MTRAKVRVTERDRGWNELRKSLGQQPMHVVVGVQGNDDAREGEGIGNVALAGVHEFGGGNVPERSFLRSTLAANKSNYETLVGKLTKAVVENRIDLHQALGLLGEKVVSDVRDRIERDDLGVPLAQSTIDRKGSSVPLIDTGQLRNSITYEVRRSEVKASK